MIRFLACGLWLLLSRPLTRCLTAVYIGGFVSLCDDTAENCVKAQRNPTAQPHSATPTKMGDYSSPIIKFSMYRDLFLNRWSFIQASRLNRIVTALWRLVEGRPAPSLLPPRLDLLLFIYLVYYKWFVSLSQYLSISPCLRIVLKGLAVCAAIPLHVKFYFVLHHSILHFKEIQCLRIARW